MATRTIVTLVDDLDGSTADETVPFGLDGADYEIDLSSEHAKEFRAAIEGYVAAARRTGGRGSTSSGSPVRAQKPATGAARERNQEIRAWAVSNGAALAERGRIPGYVVEAFEAGDVSKLTDAAGGNNTIAAASASPSVEAERSAPSGGEGETRGRDGLTTSERETIRQWAANEDIEVKSRGILKKDLIANYQAWSARQS